MKRRRDEGIGTFLIGLSILLCAASALAAMPAGGHSAGASHAAQSAKPRWKSTAKYDAFEAFYNEKDARQQLARIQVFCGTTRHWISGFMPT